MINLEHYFRDLVVGKRRRPLDCLAMACLKLCSVPYSLVLRFRAFAYAAGIFRSFSLPRPVISVGNLTVGGTGKTPMVAWLAEYLMARGKRVAVLSRGYGGSAEGETRVVSDGTDVLLSPEEAGDEPVLLARTVPGLMVVIGTNRHRAGLFALERLNPDIFILDDGFQHMRLKRNLNILLMDGRRPLGNGSTLPAGFLREPSSAAGRADIVVYTRCPADAPSTTAHDDKPFCTTVHRLTGLVPLSGGGSATFGLLRDERVVAFAGIADPATFFSALEGEGVRLADTLAFPDHTAYGDGEIDAIRRMKESSDATVLLTTCKDAVKLAPSQEKLSPCYAATMRLEFSDSAPLERLVEKVL